MRRSPHPSKWKNPLPPFSMPRSEERNSPSFFPREEKLMTNIMSPCLLKNAPPFVWERRTSFLFFPFSLNRLVAVEEGPPPSRVFLPFPLGVTEGRGLSFPFLLEVAAEEPFFLFFPSWKKNRGRLHLLFLRPSFFRIQVACFPPPFHLLRRARVCKECSSFLLFFRRFLNLCTKNRSPLLPL